MSFLTLALAVILQVGHSSNGRFNALRVDSLGGSFRCDVGCQRPTGRTLLRNKLLRACGWLVVDVPYFEWNALRSSQARTEYLKAAIALEVRLARCCSDSTLFFQRRLCYWVARGSLVVFPHFGCVFGMVCTGLEVYLTAPLVSGVPYVCLVLWNGQMLTRRVAGVVLRDCPLKSPSL